MIFRYLFSMLIAFHLAPFLYSSNLDAHFPRIVSIADTSIIPVVQSNQTVDARVIMGTDSNTFQVIPQSSVNEGVLLESVNPLTGAGINTGFFLRDTSRWDFYTNG